MLNRLNQIIFEKWLKLKDITRSQILWLARELVKNSVLGADGVITVLMRQIAGKLMQITLSFFINTKSSLNTVLYFILLFYNLSFVYLLLVTILLSFLYLKTFKHSFIKLLHIKIHFLNCKFRWGHNTEECVAGRKCAGYTRRIQVGCFVMRSSVILDLLTMLRFKIH